MLRSLGFPFQPTLPLRGATWTSVSHPFPALFQPTLPLRGATNDERIGCRWTQVSTHAPLAGSDVFRAGLKLADVGFNPRSPCGERPVLLGGFSVSKHVSTHAPLAGSDAACLLMKRPNDPFQPTLPLRGATEEKFFLTDFRCFNPRSPCGERRNTFRKLMG